MKYPPNLKIEKTKMNTERVRAASKGIASLTGRTDAAKVCIVKIEQRAERGEEEVRRTAAGK